MATLTVAVLGAGVSGLTAALALGRAGHRVTLIERDEVTAGEALDAVDWHRPGIPHFLQAHAFTARGRSELRASFPDVYGALLDAGARDVESTDGHAWTTVAAGLHTVSTSRYLSRIRGPRLAIVRL